MSVFVAARYRHFLEVCIDVLRVACTGVLSLPRSLSEHACVCVVCSVCSVCVVCVVCSVCSVCVVCVVCV